MIVCTTVKNHLLSTSKTLLNWLLLILFTAVFLHSGDLSGQTTKEDPRTVTQEIRELEKAKKLHVKTITAVIKQKGGFAKYSPPEGMIIQYLIFDKNGNNIEHTWFKAGKTVDRKWMYEYDQKGNITKLIGIDDLKRQQYIRESTYDEHSREIERTEFKANVSETYTIKYKYDSNGNLINMDMYRSDNSLAWAESYLYKGNLLMEKNSYNEKGDKASTMQYKHNDAGLIIEEINQDAPEGYRSMNKYKYDEKGRLTEHITPNSRQLFSYNENGDVVEDILFNGFGGRQHKFEFTYLPNGLLNQRLKYSPTDKLDYIITYHYEY